MIFRDEPCLPCDKRTQDEFQLTMHGWLNIEDPLERLIWLRDFANKQGGGNYFQQLFQQISDGFCMAWKKETYF